MISHLSIPQYLLESSFCLAVFYLFYYLLLKKETYFQINRLYLIGTAFLSLLIPVVNVDFNSASQFAGAETILPFISQVNEMQIGIQQTIAQESNILQISIADVINWIYMAGFFFMALKLFSGLFKLFGIINKSPKLKDQDHTLLISEDIPAASFFSYIFWKDKHDKSDPIQKTILDHEMVHVRQWHSLDVVIMELMVIIKWFNPLIYLFRNSLKKTHEFIADRYVTNQMGDKLQYANILLSNSAATDTPPISNHFYGNIRERIQMLGSKQSSKIQQFKYFAIIPLTIILFSFFSFDLSEKLPQPFKSSFQNIENSMMAVIEKNVVSLDLDENKEKSMFHLAWGDLMKIKLNQSTNIQDFLFYYSKEDLNSLLSASPTISQNGKNLTVYIDTLEVMTSSGKKEFSLQSLKDEAFRAFIIDSLERFDQLSLGLRTFSDTDSLSIKIHLGIDQGSIQKVTFEGMPVNQGLFLKWGQRKIPFNERIVIDGRRLNLDESVTVDELNNMLDSRLEVSLDAKNYQELPTNMTISFSMSRVDNSNLANIDANSMEKFRKEHGISGKVIAIESNYHGKSYSIKENSKTYTLENFYNEKYAFIDWMTNAQNGDVIRVKIEGDYQDIGKFEFNLIYRDETEAITAPFPIDLPHTTESYSNFQIIMNESGKSYVRIDAHDPNNKRIVDTYSGSDSYEIIHIDDFKTKNRVNESNLPAGNFSLDITNNLDIAQLNILTLNDYYSKKDQLIRMDWGKMVSMPNIGNYSIKEFKRSSRQKLALFAGTKNIKLARFDLVIIPENGKIERIRTDNINTQSIRETLSKVDVNTSIYVDNIIIDIDNEYRYYPYNFVFTVE